MPCEQYLQILLLLADDLDALRSEPLLKLCVNVGQQDAQQKVQHDAKESDEKEAGEPVFLVAGQHDVGEVRRRQQNHHVVERVGASVKVDERGGRQIDLVHYLRVDQNEHYDSTEDDE